MKNYLVNCDFNQHKRRTVKITNSHKLKQQTAPTFGLVDLASLVGFIH